MSIIYPISISYTSRESSSDWDFDDTMTKSNAGKSPHGEAGGEMIDFDRN